MSIKKKYDINKDRRRARRELDIEEGTYNRFKNKTFKNKKDYSRKEKHKKRWEE
jgi:hypothetical protein